MVILMMTVVDIVARIGKSTNLGMRKAMILVLMMGLLIVG